MSSLLQVDHNNGISTLSINRPEKRNAFDDQLIQELISQLTNIASDSKTHIIILRSEGKHFSAGADLAWMKRMAQLNYQENLKDASELARLMTLLNEMPQPTIALVQGAAYGGAVGLACCCDIVIGTEVTQFCLSEVKLGLAPATIAPFVIYAIGQRQARRYMLSAEVIDANTALQIGLLHQIVKQDQLKQQGQTLAENMITHGPNALRATKELIRRVNNHSFDQELVHYTERLIAQLRVSAEGQEGLTAFFEKRSPIWPITDSTNE